MEITKEQYEYALNRIEELKVARVLCTNLGMTPSEVLGL